MESTMLSFYENIDHLLPSTQAALAGWAPKGFNISYGQVTQTTASLDTAASPATLWLTNSPIMLQINEMFFKLSPYVATKPTSSITCFPDALTDYEKFVAKLAEPKNETHLEAFSNAINANLKSFKTFRKDLSYEAEALECLMPILVFFFIVNALLLFLPSPGANLFNYKHAKEQAHNKATAQTLTDGKRASSFFKNVKATLKNFFKLRP